MAPVAAFFSRCKRSYWHARSVRAAGPHGACQPPSHRRRRCCRTQNAARLGPRSRRRGRGNARCSAKDDGEGEGAPGCSSLRIQDRIATSSRACWESWRAALLPGRPPCLGRPIVGLACEWLSGSGGGENSGGAWTILRPARRPAARSVTRADVGTCSPCAARQDGNLAELRVAAASWLGRGSRRGSLPAGRPARGRRRRRRGFWAAGWTGAARSRPARRPAAARRPPLASHGGYSNGGFSPTASALTRPSISRTLTDPMASTCRRPMPL